MCRTCTFKIQALSYSGYQSKEGIDTKLCGMIDVLERRDTIQRDLDRLERWASMNLVKFSKAMCKSPHMD